MCGYSTQNGKEVKKLYCKNCGAVVIGKYCACCGTRVRSDVEEFRLYIKRAKTTFKAQHKNDQPWSFWLADACWKIAALKYGVVEYNFNLPTLPCNAYENLAIVEAKAEWLFNQLRNF